MLKINALIPLFSLLSHLCLCWTRVPHITVDLAAQILINLSHLKAFILSFPFSSNKKPETHFQSLNWNLRRFWRCYYLDLNQLWGKPWGVLTYFQWHPRVQAVFSCSHSLWFSSTKFSSHSFNESGIKNTEQETQKWTTKAYQNSPGIFWFANPTGNGLKGEFLLERVWFLARKFPWQYFEMSALVE